MPDSSNRPLKVFICHASGDKQIVRELYRRLTAEGWIDVWLDEMKLLPGHDWRTEIEKAVEECDIVIACLSIRSVDKEGYIQKELSLILNIAYDKPESSLFIIPLRLEDCSVPRGLRHWRCVDYYPERQKGFAYQRLLGGLKIRARRLGISFDKLGMNLHRMTSEKHDAGPKKDNFNTSLLAKLPKAQRLEEKQFSPLRKPVLSSERAVQDLVTSRRSLEDKITIPKLNDLPLGRISSISLVIVLLGWVGTIFLQKLPSFNTPRVSTATLNSYPATVPQQTETSTPARPTQTSTYTPSSIEIPIYSTPTSGIGSTKIGKDGMTLLYVPAGEFTMGSDSGELDEKPVHRVYLDAFWIDQTEVTNAMYARCVVTGACDRPPASSETRGSYYGNPDFGNYPVIFLFWKMAKTYCEWVDRRLPIEAEWEKAARGTDGRTYPWGDDAPNNSLLNYNSAVGDTTEVGKYPNGASPYGALDMAGNVWEWVGNWYDAYPGNPVSDSSYGTTYQVLRGGSWYDSSYFVRSESRYKIYASNSSSGTGFRCAVSDSSQAGSTQFVQASTNTPSATEISQPTITSKPSPTETSMATTPTLNISSTMIGQDGMTLLYVPAGEFTMGSDSSELGEKPVHRVYLDAFWIDQTEVTNVLYARCVNDGDCSPPSSTKSSTRDSYYGNSDFDLYPVINVSWNDANAYCSWVGRRLPTEAEWEKTARGTDGPTYPWGNNAPNNNLLNYNNGMGDTVEVGRYPDGASPYGTLDMAGNVWEWVADWYAETYYVSSPTFNPVGPDSGEYRVLRGGSWFNDADFVRSTLRRGGDTSSSLNIIGFRCARSP